MEGQTPFAHESSPALRRAAPFRKRTLSLLIPAHNAAATLPRLAASIHAAGTSEELAEVEVSVCVDGVPDGAAFNGLEKFAGLALRLCANAVPHGCGPARNDAFANSTGRYVWPVDADDELHPGALGHLLRVLRDGPDVVYCNEHDPSGKMVGIHVLRPRDPGALARCPIAPWTKCCRRELYVPFLNFHPDDVIPHFLLCDRARTVAVVETPVYVYHKTPGSIMRGEEALRANRRTVRELAEDPVARPFAVGQLRNLAGMVELGGRLRNPAVLAAWRDRLGNELRRLRAAVDLGA